MMDTEKTVFISYRRDVASFIARAIFMDLLAWLGWMDSLIEAAQGLMASMAEG